MQISTDYRSPNYNGRPAGTTVDTIVLHATAGDLSPSLAWLTTPRSGVSAHYVIARGGRIFELVEPARRAWHAGTSRMPDGREDVNDFSIGVELVNRNDGTDSYPPAQVEAAAWLCRHLADTHPVEHIVSHTAIALPAGRKIDPRGFDVDAFRAQVLDGEKYPLTRQAGIHLANWMRTLRDIDWEVVSRLRPYMVVFMDNIAPAAVNEIARRVPDVHLFYRPYYPPGSNHAQYRNTAAERTAGYLAGEFTHTRAARDGGRFHLCPYNEPNLQQVEKWPGGVEGMRLWNQQFLNFYAELKGAFPEVKIGGPALTPGHSDVWFAGDTEGTDYWFHGSEAARPDPTPEQIEAAKQSCLIRDALLTMDECHVHIYPPTIEATDYAWYGRRWQAYERFFPRPLPIWIKEFDAGMEAKDQQYRAEAVRRFYEVHRQYPQVQGVAGWWVGEGDITWDWHTYDDKQTGALRPIVPAIEAHLASIGDEPNEPAPEPEPEPPEVPAPELPERVTDFGDLPLSVETPAVDAGDLFWFARSVKVLDPDDGNGLHHIFVRCFDDAGERQTKIMVRVSWPDGSDDGQTEAKPLSEYGDFNFVMAGQGWDPADGPGPYSVEIIGPLGYASETVAGMGMPLNHHYSLVVEFQLVRMPAEVPEVPALEDVLREAAEDSVLVRYNPDAALQKRVVAAIERGVPLGINSNEFQIDHDGETYIGQRTEHLESGVVTVLYVREGDWNNVQTLTYEVQA